MDTPAERQTAYDIASQSVVLLENTGILPLRDKKRIFLTGPNANSMWAMCGDYTFPSMAYFWKMITDSLDNPHIVTLREGMESRRPEDISVSYSRGCDWTDTVETKYNATGDARAWEYRVLNRKVDSGEKADAGEALAMAADADVIVAAMGENVMLCGENRDRQGLLLPGRQQEYVERLIATGKPVVLVLFGGRAQVVSGLAEKCAAVIQAWYPGEEGGNAVADILFGNVSPSGKLSVSYPAEEIYEPICYNYSDTVDSRVAWEFGHGLSYSTFEYKDLQVPATASVSDDYVDISFKVTNTGSMKADEVAQVYLSPKSESGLYRPIQLQGFARISLEPGETKTVMTRLYPDQFGYYSNDGQRQWNIAPGDFVIKIGASSADIRLSKPLSLTGDKISKPLRDRYFSESAVK